MVDRLIVFSVMFSSSLKNLIPVSFSFPSSSDSTRHAAGGDDNPKVVKKDEDPICPCCKKTFSNSLLMFRTSFRLLTCPAFKFPTVMKPCSHVTCKTCTDTLTRGSNQCIVCDTKLGEKDIIELKREGTESICWLDAISDLYPEF
jgi:nitric oxide synthase-interacting protein